jgi:2-amino-4-hydroxy-6-hydroxymethyldihydropteridine diphosphokinase
VPASSRRRVYLSLGSNLGDRVARLREALDGLRAGGIEIDAVSPLYETAAWGVEDQPDFANIAASGETELAAVAILDLAKSLEAAAGRDFDAPRWTARPLDIDIVLIDGEQVASERLTVPHALMQERAFVLVPLADIADSAVHPMLGRTVTELRDALARKDLDGVWRLEGAEDAWYGAEGG